jgi:hypothetical protein
LVIYQNLYQGLFFSSNALAFSSNSLALIFSCSEEKRLAEEKAKHAEQEKIKAKELEEKVKAKELEEKAKAKELEEKAKAKELEEKANAISIDIN